MMGIVEILVALAVTFVVSSVLSFIFDFGSCQSCKKLTYQEYMGKSGDFFFCEHCEKIERQAEKKKEQEAFKERLQKEKIIQCPHCQIAMKKEIIENKILVDKCEKHGIWLDTGELERIKKSVKRRTENSSSSSSSGSSDGGSNFALGLAVGMTMN